MVEENIDMCRIDKGTWAATPLVRLCLLLISEKKSRKKMKTAKKLADVIGQNMKAARNIRNGLEREACYEACTDFLSYMDSCWIRNRFPNIFNDIVCKVQEAINMFGEAVDMLDERKSRVKAMNNSAMALEEHAERLANSLIPTEKDRDTREKVLKNFLTFVESEKIPGLSIVVYGSNESGFLTSESDFDITVSTTKTSMSAKSVMKTLHERVSKSSMYDDIYFIKGAKIPILTFSHKETGLEFDICADNPLPQYNTELLRTYSKCDPRVRKLIVLVKTWAKRKGIGSSSSGHLSSYSWSLMVVFFLQIAKVVPVLTSPELAKLDKSGKTARFCRDVEVANKTLPAKDTRSVADLLREFFTFYAWQFNRSGSCICVRSGKLKSFKAKRRRQGRDNWFVILDPFESNQNKFIPNDVQDTRRIARDLGSTVISVRCVSRYLVDL